MVIFLSFVVLRNGAWEIVHWEKVLQQMVFHIPIASLSSSLKMSWHTLRNRVRNDYAYKDAQWCKPEQVWFETDTLVFYEEGTSVSALFILFILT